MKRTHGAVAALTMVVLIGAGCSNAPARTSTGTSTVGTTTPDRSRPPLTFAECMRQNGVKAFPDPDPSGELTIDGVVNGSSLDADSPLFKQAMSACRDLEPSGFTGHKRTTAQQKAALEFAKCMRDNGVPDFTDPDPDGPLINIDGSKPGLREAVHAAGQKCAKFATAAGVTGGK